MPADGISLPPKKGGLRHVPLGRLEDRLHQRRPLAEGGMTACGTTRTSQSPLDMSVHWGEAVMLTSHSK